MNLESIIRAAVSQFGISSSESIQGLLKALLNLFADEHSGGFAGFLEKLRSAGLGSVVNDWLAGRTGEPLTGVVMEKALGGSLLSQLSNAAGTSQASAASMLGFLVPKLVGALTPGGSMPQRSDITGALGSLASLTSGGSGAMHGRGESGGSGWLWPIVLGAMLLFGVLWVFNQGKTPPVHDVAKEAAKTATETASSAASALTDATRAAWAALGEFFKRKLPNGVELNIPRLGVENRLVDFIEDAARPVDKTTWFDFDRLLFDTGKATLQPASQEQLENIAAILKAFPKVAIKVGGYTDNTGDKAANMKLSADRANNVMNELIRLGVDAKRLSAEGYGDQHPVADNATEEGRAKNRRISMRVTEK